MSGLPIIAAIYHRTNNFAGFKLQIVKWIFDSLHQTKNIISVEIFVSQPLIPAHPLVPSS